MAGTSAEAAICTLFFPPQQQTTWTDDDVSNFVKSCDRLSDAGSAASKLLSHRTLDPSPDHHVLELTISSGIPLATLRNLEFLTALQGELGVEAVFRDPKTQQLHPPRLAVFDMDSTLIQQEVIELLAAHAGVEDRVAAITSRAMNGELDFYESLRERVALLKGIPETVFDELKPQLLLMPGAKELLTCLRNMGVKTAVLSGGFMPLATHIAQVLRIDHVHANQLAVEDGKLTGTLVEGSDIIHAERKRDLLVSIAREEGLTSNDLVVAVGDGANDLPMMWQAGLGMAINAKPKVQAQAPCRLNTKSMVDVLHILGYTQEEIKKQRDIGGK